MFLYLKQNSISLNLDNVNYMRQYEQDEMNPETAEKTGNKITVVEVSFRDGKELVWKKYTLEKMMERVQQAEVING